MERKVERLSDIPKAGTKQLTVADIKRAIDRLRAEAEVENRGVQWSIR